MNYRLLSFFASVIIVMGVSASPNTLQVQGPAIPKKPTVHQVTFDNGIKAEAVGNTIVVTHANGNRQVINHPGPAPGERRPDMTCQQLYKWLGSHSANDAKWHRRCRSYFDFCL